ncbi:MAG TPA: D-alanine--D-alanine ligase family protein [Clostridia bacterium]|nr:D-alanine--D-alanine ligase family protein [Clostridia bacterium]
MAKINVGVIFGGVSTEHEVSRWSAVHVLRSLDKDLFTFTLFEISKSGELYAYDTGSGGMDFLYEEIVKIENSIPKEKVYFSTELVSRYSLDVVFPVLHGTGGEDGVLQGLLELFDIPYIGAGVTGSAIAFDKVITKELLKVRGIKQASYFVLTSDEIKGDIREKIDEAVEILGYPIFVKPANGGSSVGIFKAKDRTGLIKAVNEAARYDRKVILEESISGRELECAVIGGYSDVTALGVGEIVPCNVFYDYEAKYINEGSKVLVPADIEDETRDAIMEIAVDSFRYIECHGLARIDFFLGENGVIYLNEINTMPGFTKISMYPKLWRHSGGSDSELITRLIDLAYERKNNYRFLKDYTRNE